MSRRGHLFGERATVLATALAIAAASGCGTAPSDAASAGAGSSGSGEGGRGGETVIETDCDAGDEVCPETRPFEGAPCEGELECEYIEDAGQTTWVITCVDGAWSSWASCELLPTGCQQIPPPAEACEPPFEGVLEAKAEVGPASEETFRPFEDGELIEIVWGAQGSAMLFYRLKLDGPELPTCVALTVSFESAAFVEAIPGHETVVLRCGQSLSIYTIIPYGECAGDDPSFDATFRVLVHGIGEVVQPVRIPTEALCGGVG